MAELKYDIHMNTPLGKKPGQLTAERNGSTLNGWLDILGHQEPFEGTVDEAGNCDITGFFITLLRKVPFAATGQITDAAVHLQIKGERNVFELSGTVCLEREE